VPLTHPFSSFDPNWIADASVVPVSSDFSGAGFVESDSAIRLRSRQSLGTLPGTLAIVVMIADTSDAVLAAPTAMADPSARRGLALRV
jgi:hypothetical protein